jgi:hypothetical protein
MSHVTGKLATIMDNAVEPGSVVIALCGYSGQIPRYTAGDGAFYARPTTFEVDVDDLGFFNALLPGNDTILPEGTYYTVTVKNSNGDAVQVNAYIFINSEDYDLSLTSPFDPTLSPSPLPPLIFDQLLTLPATDPMTFDGGSLTAFKTVLHTDVTHTTFTNMVPGNLYTFIIVQDVTGGWEFSWGDNVHNGTMVKHDAFAQTIQTFVAEEDGHLYAVSAGAYYP